MYRILLNMRSSKHPHSYNCMLSLVLCVVLQSSNDDEQMIMFLDYPITIEFDIDNDNKRLIYQSRRK